jgi:hypothetical protein
VIRWEGAALADEVAALAAGLGEGAVPACPVRCSRRSRPARRPLGSLRRRPLLRVDNSPSFRRVRPSKLPPRGAILAPCCSACPNRYQRWTKAPEGQDARAFETAAEAQEFLARIGDLAETARMVAFKSATVLWRAPRRSGGSISSFQRITNGCNFGDDLVAASPEKSARRTWIRTAFLLFTGVLLFVAVTVFPGDPRSSNPSDDRETPHKKEAPEAPPPASLLSMTGAG